MIKRKEKENCQMSRGGLSISLQTFETALGFLSPSFNLPSYDP